MRILIIRHGDPDYEHDSLTDLGRRQAENLSRILRELPIRRICSSPYGRARETASYTAEALSLEVEILPFLREFTDVTIPTRLRSDLAVWNIPPRELYAYGRQADWQRRPPFSETLLQQRLQEMEEGTDELFRSYGMTRQTEGYALERDLSAEGDIAVFCHQGAGLTWMAQLLQLSLTDVWRTCYVSPTSVTTLLLEQSEPQFGSFRLLGMGDVSHLVSSGTENDQTGLLYNRS